MELVGPSDAGYDRLRAVFDSRVDRRPAVVACCRSAADVGLALEYAASHGLPLAVRGGGMSAAATIDGGVVVDVSSLKRIELDVAGREARVGGGVTWAELDSATSPHGLGVTGGRVSWMGVAGVALGEGSGWLERALGPTGHSVVTAEATGVVVTSLTLRLAPVEPAMLCGLLTFPAGRAREVAAAYRDRMADAPPAVGGALTLYAGRAGGCQLAFCFSGPVDDAAAWLRPLRALGPSLDAVTENPYPAFQAMTDSQHPIGMRAERRVRRIDELSDDALDALLEAAARPSGSALSRVVLRPGAGRAWTCEVLGLWPPVPSLDAANLAWVDGAEAAAASRSDPAAATPAAPRRRSA